MTDNPFTAEALANAVDLYRPNAELAWRIYDLATKYPHHFNMDNWATLNGVRYNDDPNFGVTLAQLTTDQNCGTTACLAGWVAADAGHAINDGFIIDTENRTDLREWATRQLRIDDAQAEELFYCDNAELHTVMTRIFGPHPNHT